MAQQNFSMRSPAVKRLMQEAKELKSPTEMYHAYPVDDNLFDWHFTVRGAADTAFEGGVYHGRITLPADYPMKPPSIMLFTPNGRFSLNRKICLSISGHHPETWQPSWSIRTALLAIIGFMPTPGHGAIGSLDYPEEERKKLAVSSANWSCPQCKAVMKSALPPLSSEASVADAEAKELAKEISFKGATTSPLNSTSTEPDETSPVDATESTIASPPQEEQPRVRRRRRVPRTTTASNVNDLPAMGINYSTLMLNLCIVLCIAALGLLIARRLYFKGEMAGAMQTTAENIIVSQMGGEDISTNGHRTVSPQPPPSNDRNKPASP